MAPERLPCSIAGSGLHEKVTVDFSVSGKKSDIGVEVIHVESILLTLKLTISRSIRLSRG